ncbi:MAG: tetratricopeptide repeat protein [Micrococcales bacterium]|nr:tetratricopeptide repeat protein [Micrococcales bacterium]
MSRRRNKTIEDLLDEIDMTVMMEGHGPQERALIDQALALSRETGDERAEYKVRMRLTYAATFTGDTDAQISSFAWCLAKHDADPRSFPNDVGNNSLMWQFKWVASALTRSPVFSLAQCDALLDDMEAHYARAGLGMSAVVGARFEHAWTVGDIDRARQLRAQCQATPRDDHSDCEVCVRSTLADFAAETGEEALALRLVDEIVDDGGACEEEPEVVLGTTLIAKLRAGRTADARDAHMQSYRLARNKPELIVTIANNMVFCVITGNEARGLAMVERHISWLAHNALNEDGQCTMLAAVALVLESVARTGHGDQVVRGADTPSLQQFFGPRQGVWTVAELAPCAWQAAGRLAAAFDTRNGNSYVSDKIARTRALLGERYDVPILTEVFLPPSVVPAAPTTAQRWLDLAEVYANGSVPDLAVEAAVKVLDPQIPSGDPSSQTPGPTLEQQARATGLIISSYVGLDRIDDARLALPRRIAAVRAQGRLGLADLEERLGLVMFGQCSPETVAVLAAEVARLAAAADDAVVNAELLLAQTLLGEQDPDMARAVSLLESTVVRTRSRLDDPGFSRLHMGAWYARMMVHVMRQELPQAAEMSGHILGLDLSDGQRALVLSQRARILGTLERYDEAVAAADAAVRIYASYGAAKPLVDTIMLAVALEQGAGRLDDALARLRYALREAEQAELDTTGVRYALGRVLVATGHPNDGVEILWQVLDDEETAGAPPQARAETCLALEKGFEAAEIYGSALAMCERAADLWLEADQPVVAAESLRLMGNLLRGFELYDESLDALSRAWDLVKDSDALGMQVEVLESRAFTKGAAGNRSALSDIDQAIAITQRHPDGPVAWKIADLTDSRARVLMGAERRDEAVAGFLQAADGYARAGDLPSAALAEHFAAQNLAGPLARPAEALGIWHSALGHVDAARAQGQDTADLRESILVMLAEALDSVGRAAEAASIRSQITSQASS